MLAGQIARRLRSHYDSSKIRRRCEGTKRGKCVPATENFYYGSCHLSAPRLTRACLCDNTQKEILLDCSGLHEAFKNLGDCE